MKGGGAWERDRYEFRTLGATFFSASQTRGGWTVGVGGEYAFTDSLSGFVEYNYYDFGDREYFRRSGRSFFRTETSRRPRASCEAA